MSAVLHDTPEAIAITEDSAKRLIAHEMSLDGISKGVPQMPVVGEICPVGTLAKLQKMTALVMQLREVMA